MQLGYEVERRGAGKDVFARFKELADRKKTVTDRDIEALVSTQKTIVMPVYELESFVISSGSAIQTMATVCLTKDERIEGGGRQGGMGPIDAAFSAVEKMRAGRMWSSKTYSIQAITEGEDAHGRGCGQAFPYKDGHTVHGPRAFHQHHRGFDIARMSMA